MNEPMIALLLIVLLETLLIAKISIENKSLKKILAETLNKTRLIEKIYEWQALQEEIKKKSAKPRKRYLVFRIITNNDLTQEQVWEIIKKTIIRLYGEPFIKKSMATLVYYNPRKKTGILRTTNIHKEHIIAALGFTFDKDVRTIFLPVKITGSIKRAKEYVY